jgi:hypothetical protein
MVALAAGCASRSAPVVAVPPASGKLAVAAMAGDQMDEVQPVAVAVTNGGSTAVPLDARQVFAVMPAGERVAPLPPADAARRAGGARLPGAVTAGAKGAVGGGLLGAIGGAIAGAIQGGISGAVAAGAAVGAALGTITGVLTGGREQPDVAGFTERALRDSTLAPGTSATGWVYYPAATYDAIEVVVPGGSRPMVERVPLERRE